MPIDKQNQAVPEDLAVVIMAGGAGSRFWPLSTDQKPKQFLKLFDDRSLLRISYERIADLLPPERVLVLTNEAFTGLVKEQLPEIPPGNIIGEPIRRDTAAAVCLGAVLCHRRFGNPVMVILTADHLIEPVEVFQKALLSAAREARAMGALYTFGVQPTFPATAYGYLETGDRLNEDDGVEHFQLVSFKEKPDIDTARRYLETGKYLWNSGMFVWTVDAILEELTRHLPEHVRAICRATDFDRTPRWFDAVRTAFKPLQAISIDYAVMEKARDIRCAVSNFSWRDVGDWLSLGDFLPGDRAGNLRRGRVHGLDAQRNLVFCEDPDETVLLVGVQDLIVVRAGDRTLIVPKDRTEDVKKLVNSIESKK